MTKTEREERLAALDTAIRELTPFVYKMRLNQNFLWMPSLLAALRAAADLLQAEDPQPQPEKPAGQDIGPLDFGAHSPR